MRPSSEERWSTFLLPPPHLAKHLYAEFLHAHECGEARGHPLLTPEGISYLVECLQADDRWEKGGEDPFDDSAQRLGAANLPDWDAESRQLWYRGRVVKEFRQPAPHQTRILDVFQEQGWIGEHIDDPLPGKVGEHEEDGKKRLHDTIKNLNRGLPPGTIRFKGDGTGQGVRWTEASASRRIRDVDAANRRLQPPT